MAMTRPGVGGLPPHVDQLGLFAAHGDGIEAAFWKFHEANPRVYELLAHFARQAKENGRRKFGAKMLMERLRWYVEIETNDDSGLKLNNNHTSRYARLLMARERCDHTCQGCEKTSCFAGLFDLRSLDQPTAILE
jgi:hypothetical protein